jgi:erythromycin esterase-like protein
MTDPTVDSVRRHAIPVDLDTGLNRVVDLIDDARLVLLGEASHGTHEFYRARADITRELITHHGFNLIAVEADWPDAHRAHRWIRLSNRDATAEEALADFTRFPRWMWRNTVVVDFLQWLRDWNTSRPLQAQAAFYGLDLYSLHRSIECVLQYLQTIDPDAARLARHRYSCFDVFGEDVQAYGYATSVGLSSSCEDGVVAQLVDLRKRAADYATRDGRVAADDYFVAEQNARVVQNAEMYYRTMFRGNVESWNVRDQHMMSTLEALLAHVSRTNGAARAVVWAHNSHLGDARATSRSARGELNLGQLTRQRFPNQCRLIGFTTHSGTVTAASNWDNPAHLMVVRPSIPGSYERLFHEVGLPAFLLPLTDPDLRSALTGPRLERAIGVIYRPDTERASHYFHARLPHQFDAIIHIDTTSAVRPLETWSRHEVDLPETYPSGV